MSSSRDDSHEVPARLPSISPPPKRRRIQTSRDSKGKSSVEDPLQTTSTHASSPIKPKPAETRFQTIESPVQLNFVDALGPQANRDTVSLGSILGEVMIRECWLFNYLFDFDFIMSKFDPDVRALVKIHAVHGSWKQEDRNRLGIEEAKRKYPNIEDIKAYLPDPFGTHHTKMIILFRHDELAQIIILTGNFIAQDWVMSQALWKSPLLRLENSQVDSDPGPTAIGSGARFKIDMLAYLNAYGSKLKNLKSELAKYNFEEIRGALVASTPAKQDLHSLSETDSIRWGWPGLKQTLSVIPASSKESRPHIMIQISSVASVGEPWLFSTFFPALSTIAAGDLMPGNQANKPKYSIIFPTAAEIRRSLNGYGSGASIHMKTHQPTHQKQLRAIHPMLCHWAGKETLSIHRVLQNQGQPASLVREAHRSRAAPHIKTYLRFSDDSCTKINWALMTSANLSKQAWGMAANGQGEVKVSSYELGVLVWPSLWDDCVKEGEMVEMVPTFGIDTPELSPTHAKLQLDEPEDEKETLERSSTQADESHDVGPDVKAKAKADVVTENGRPEDEETPNAAVTVGYRMPYDLPLVPYAEDEEPWCNSVPHMDPDWRGGVWTG